MRVWKNQENVKKVHNDLYTPIDPNDPSSETYITKIIRTVFPDKDRTKRNAIWAQSVLESIFDVKHLSPKVNAEIVDSWIETLTDVIHFYSVFINYSICYLFTLIIIGLFRMKICNRRKALKRRPDVRSLLVKTNRITNIRLCIWE